MWREHLDDEQGVALLYAIFAVLIITGLVTIFLVRSLFETQQTAEGRDRETAVHVAEAGAESIIPAVNGEGETLDEAIAAGSLSTLNTTTNGGYSTVSYTNATGTYQLLEYDPAVLTTENLEEQWLLDIVEDNPALLRPLDRGEGAWLRPVVEVSSGVYEKTDLLFGVGFVPSYDAWLNARGQQRAIKLEMNRSLFSPDFALLVDGPLDFGGNAEILAEDCDPADPNLVDCNAAVHSNQTATFAGSSSIIQGRFSAVGDDQGTDPTTVPGGEFYYGEEEEPFPSIDPRAFYNRDTALNVDPGGATVENWDLCPDGTVKTPAGSTPCSGGTVWDSAVDSTDFLGWDFGPQGWDANDIEPGYFYVYGSNASVRGSAGNGPRAVTIIVEADDAAPLSTSSGSLSMSGNPSLVSALPDVLFIVEKDIELRGTSGGGSQPTCDPNIPNDCDLQDYTGLISAGHQFSGSGTVDLEGAILVEDVRDDGNPVSRNTDGINGTLRLTYDDQLTVDLNSRVTLEYWKQL